MSYDEEIDYLLKIIVVGDSGVGKTNLIQRYTKDKFSPEFASTLGVDFSSLDVQLKNKRVKIQFWDTAGQEKYKAISQAYYKNTHGVFIVYDITNKQSFDRAVVWFQELKHYVEPNVKIMLIGNKIDLEAQRQVDSKVAQTFANSQNLLFKEVSAKSNEDNCVNSAIEKLINVIFDQMELEYESVSENRLLSLQKSGVVTKKEGSEKKNCC